MKLVIIESPYAGDTRRNIEYAKACVRDSLEREEAPLASHLLYTQSGILNDNVDHERSLGIRAGHAWLTHAEALIVYGDLGITDGMKKGIWEAYKRRVPITFRFLYSRALDFSKIFDWAIVDP